jgi:phytoene dehydrogenase-like protein
VVLPARADAVIVGAGHNGLVAATVLARAGLDVVVLERDEVIGGACRTERPFAHAPQLGASTGAYLLGPFPPELLRALDLDLPLLRRDPHYFLPTAVPGRSLLLGRDPAANRRALAAFTSERDVQALEAMQAELTALRDDLAPAWLAPPLTLEETAERYVRPELRGVFVDLVLGSVADHLGRFGFGSDLLPAMYAVTDAFPGLHGGWDTPGSGFNFLVHNLCRLPGADGTWMIVQGGMGTVTAALAERARAAGARVLTGRTVDAITTAGGRIDGVAVGDEVVGCDLVLVNADPVRLVDLAGEEAAGQDAVRVAGLVRERPGTTLKLNLALRDLPRFTALPDPVGQHHGTIHLLPDLDDPLPALRTALDEALAGQIPTRPPIEIYLHTAVDPSLQDPAGHHSGALFVQWVPNRPAEGSWDALADRTADRLLDLVDEVAPGTSDLVVDRQVLHPAAIERRFGITGGHIFHLDNSVSFTDRLPYRTATEGLYACGAGCHPAGSVIGAAGWNAAHVALDDHRGVDTSPPLRPGAAS